MHTSRRTKETQHATPTEYICSLVREDRKRAEREKLERLLLEGLDGGEPMTVADLEAYFSQKEQVLLERAGSK